MTKEQRCNSPYIKEYVISAPDGMSTSRGGWPVGMAGWRQKIGHRGQPNPLRVRGTGFIKFLLADYMKTGPLIPNPCWPVGTGRASAGGSAAWAACSAGFPWGAPVLGRGGGAASSGQFDFTLTAMACSQFRATRLGPLLRWQGLDQFDDWRGRSDRAGDQFLFCK